MPRQKLRFRQVFIALRQDQPGSLIIQHPSRRLIAAVEMLAEYDLVAIRQYRKRTEVKHLVVQGTEGNAVRYFIRAP